MLRKIAHLALFGNYYLAICIVALSVETGFKMGFVIIDSAYYLFIFSCVVVYYTYAYLGDKPADPASNLRARWYAQNRSFILVTQSLFILLMAASGLFLLYHYYTSFFVFGWIEWALFLLFPFVSLLYYGVVFPGRFSYKLRNTAWLKPFIIGFVCTGVIVVYPMLFHALRVQRHFAFSTGAFHYFVTNWLFTSAIAIMFDIKDFAADHNHLLQTFVVKKGLRFTIFSILLPIASASYVSFVLFAVLQRFSPAQIIINTLPFALLLAAAASLRRRKSILYYLTVIDGLLLLKALFGIGAMLLVEPK